MIKIIERGSRREQRCDNCGCLFSYEAIDTVTEYTVSLSGMEIHKKPYKFVRCPQCKKEVVLEAAK